MEDLSWETNMWLPWNNINHHQQETFTFGSQNIFSNPIQRLSKTDSTTYMNPITPSFESLDCLPSATNSNNADTSSDHDDGISVIFPDYNSSHDSIINNPNVISSGEYSVTKENTPRSKKLKLDPGRPGSSTINFRQGTTTESDETDSEAIAQMKEMIYRAAAFRPVSFAGEEVTEKPRRRNVRISSDPQTVAARQRREKISERIRVLQKLVPGGNKMDTASMLDEAASYLKFLRSQVKALEQFGQKIDYVKCGTSSNAESTTSQLMVGNNIGANVTVGVPLIPMQTHFLVPHQQVYPTPPPA